MHHTYLCKTHLSGGALTTVGLLLLLLLLLLPTVGLMLTTTANITTATAFGNIGTALHGIKDVSSAANCLIPAYEKTWHGVRRHRH